MTTLVLSLLLTSTSLDSTADSPLPRRPALGVGLAPIAPETREKLGLAAGRGLSAASVVAGLSAADLGVQAGDIILEMNGRQVAPGVVQEVLRTAKSGDSLTIKVLRAGKELDLKGTLKEAPRDPGTKDYEVRYSHVVSNGKRMRTIITFPRKPGKHPAFLHIQGFSPLSYDYVLKGEGAGVTRMNAPILYRFASSGYVTMRIEKPGVGDSEGGPFAAMDYTTELDIYRQGLKELASLPEVDPKKIIIFGHSMGGAFGPMIAAEIPVRGIATYGTAARTWHEYLVESVRHQGILAGASFEQADESVRQSSRLYSLVFHEGMSAEQVKKAHPSLTALVDESLPGGMFNGKTLEFWRQLGQINFPAYWVKAKTRVLAVRGASDFVTFDSDHKLIADAVNKANPGWGRFAVTPASDHIMNGWKTEKESQQNWPNGTYSPAFEKLLFSWSQEILKEKAS